MKKCPGMHGASVNTTRMQIIVELPPTISSSPSYQRVIQTFYSKEALQLFDPLNPRSNGLVRL